MIADAMGVSTGALDCLPWTTLWITAKDNLFAIRTLNDTFQIAPALHVKMGISIGYQNAT